SNTTVGSVTTSGSMNGGTLTTIAVSSDMNGTMVAHGAGTVPSITVYGNMGGKIEAQVDSDPNSGKMGTITLGSLSGDLTARDIDLLIVGGAVVGKVNASGTVAAASLGSVGSTGDLTAGTLGSLTVAGGIAGDVSATNIGTVRASGVTTTGTTVFKITQAGVERRIVAIPVNGSASLPASVTFSYFYDGSNAGNPQAVVRVT